MNVADVPGRFFLDTNILIYSFDTTALVKQQIAKNLIHDALKTQNGIISSQVVQEFLNVAIRKFTTPMTVVEAREYHKLVLSPLCQQFPSSNFYDQALLLREETGYSWYDSLILAAAVESGCSRLLSEDLQHERVVHGCTILNPFLA